VASAAPLRGLAALLDRPGDPLDVVPPLGHWLYFLPDTPQSAIADDGHPKLGSDLPDFGLPRRMWAGGRVEFVQPIPVGSALRKETTLIEMSRKTGSSGPLAFVTLRHEIQSDGRTAVIEEQDLVYRGLGGRAAAPATAPRPEASAHTSAQVVSQQRAFDPVQLFRFSALTFNGHRIHYDYDYVRNVEGYPGLVVHGPFQATLLVDLFRRTCPELSIRSFAFRSQAPLFDNQRAELRLVLTDSGGELSLSSDEHPVCMKATIRT
jgi:3-methylfumaryl-CoA hydratase